MLLSFSSFLNGDTSPTQTFNFAYSGISFGSGNTFSLSGPLLNANKFDSSLGTLTAVTFGYTAQILSVTGQITATGIPSTTSYQIGLRGNFQVNQPVSPITVNSFSPTTGTGAPHGGSAVSFAMGASSLGSSSHTITTGLSPYFALGGGMFIAADHVNGTFLIPTQLFLVEHW